MEGLVRVHGDRKASVNYRHVIGSLVKKPGAFAHYRFRKQLFPTLNFRRAYDALREWRGERAYVEYVRILHRRRPPWKPRWTAPCPCWKAMNPSITPRSRIWWIQAPKTRDLAGSRNAVPEGLRQPALTVSLAAAGVGR